LGVRLRVLAESAQDSAAQVVADCEVGHHGDLAALRRFAAGCDVVTFDHEHVPTAHLSALVDDGAVIRPGPDALVFAQDKGRMRERLAKEGAPVPRWAPVAAADDVAAFADAGDGWPVVLKATRGGYDGKGVWPVDDLDEADWVLSHDQVPGFLVEERVRFTRELAAVVARSPSGQAVAYPVVETVQIDGICREVYAPAQIAAAHSVAAQRVALDLAGRLGVVGVLAVELFDTPEGVLVNELAMRPHNSGHWTIDGAVTSQFENHLRAVLDLPLGDPSATAPHAAMVNVLGGDLPDLYPAYLHCMARDPGLKVHMYGKSVRPGRKIGHVTVVGDDPGQLKDRARHAAAYLRGDIDE
ncbi:MAG: 5-(carboxyamino)imidazole ribonucleotide synthase, partial [Actinomycetota bacterium]|nr:5-(carboxyamino)imidazole ribonucleotide synthase [Actinomycetota bacterium]